MTDYTLAQTFTPGDRVGLSPACDLWMRGAQYGTVRGIRVVTYGAARVVSQTLRQWQRSPPNLISDGVRILASVKMDHPQVRRLQYVTYDLVRHAK